VDPEEARGEEGEKRGRGKNAPEIDGVMVQLVLRASRLVSATDFSLDITPRLPKLRLL
jgi:hypothetical protein